MNEQTLRALAEKLRARLVLVDEEAQHLAERIIEAAIQAIQNEQGAMTLAYEFQLKLRNHDR